MTQPTDPRPVHPVAGLFPMLADAELDELAADIKDRGLLQPIVLDGDGRVLDGRNRLAACDRAGVDPRFETYDGDDPDGYALAVNVQRRNLRPGQRYLVVEKARRLAGGVLNRTADATAAGVDRPRLAEAAVVLDFAPDLAEVVLGGGMSLDSAAKEARERKRDAAATRAKLDRLASDAPDLAGLVEEERLDLDEAITTLDGRKAKADEERDAKDREQRQRDRERRDANIKRYTATWQAIRHLSFCSPTWLDEFDPDDFPHDADLREVLTTTTVLVAARDALDILIKEVSDDGR